MFPSANGSWLTVGRHASDLFWAIAGVAPRSQASCPLPRHILGLSGPCDLLTKLSCPALARRGGVGRIHLHGLFGDWKPVPGRSESSL